MFGASSTTAKVISRPSTTRAAAPSQIGTTCNSDTERKTVMRGVYLPASSRHWLFGVREIALRLAGRRNLIGARALEDQLRLLRPLVIVRMDGQQDAALPHPALVPFRFVLGDAESNQCTRDAADGANRA